MRVLLKANDLPRQVRKAGLAPEDVSVDKMAASTGVARVHQYLMQLRN